MSQKIYLNDAEQLIEKFSEKVVFWKDMDSRYIGCNRLYAQKCGFTDLKQMIGLNDLIINPKFTDLYLHDDKSVMQSQTIKHLYNPAFYQTDGNVFVEGTLNPVFDSRNRVTGVFGILEIKNNVFSGSFLSVLNYIRQHNIAELLKEKKYFIDSQNSIAFSKNELVCFLYAELLNLSAKEISKIIGLSPRTAEKYLERAREKRRQVPANYFDHKIQEIITQQFH